MTETLKTKVTDKGVFIPKEFLQGLEEVEIRREGNVIVVIPSTSEDPILGFGKHPVACAEPDAADHYDRYFYGQDL
jgi:hypothetical protein